MSSMEYYRLLAAIINSPFESDEQLIESWAIRYENYLHLSPPICNEHIVEGLILVHNTWWERFGKISERGWKINPKKCHYNLINPSAETCPFKIQGMTKIVNDHYWPKSLGGPEDPTNLLGLCTHHNEAKSSSVECFDFSVEPKWLKHRLKDIARLHSTVV